MKYSVLGYFIGEGFSNVFKNKKSTGASLMIMCATMIIFGIFFAFPLNPTSESTIGTCLLICRGVALTIYIAYATLS